MEGNVDDETATHAPQVDDDDGSGCDDPKVAEQPWTHAMPKGPKPNLNQGALRFHAAALPGAVELLQEQVGCQQPDGLRVDAFGR
jgi:hypothetical protein